MQPIDLYSVILELFREIRSYSGDFGDGIETGSINPFEQLKRSDLTDFERLGLSVFVLCNLQSDINNSTCEDTERSQQARDAKFLLDSGDFSIQTEVVGALGTFFESEVKFNLNLKSVYDNIVLSKLERVDGPA